MDRATRLPAALRPHDGNPPAAAAAAAVPATRRPFVPVPYDREDHVRIQRLLNKVLGPEYVLSRPGGGGTSVLYIEGWKALNLANEIFGFNGWNSELISQQVDYIDTHGNSGRFLMGLLVVVRVTIRDGTFHEDFGYGYIDNAKSKAMAFEKCRKEAFTDGIKRCLRCFGNVLGNCLYDRTIISKIKSAALPKPPMEDTDFYRDVAIYDVELRKRRETRVNIMELPRGRAHANDQGSDNDQVLDNDQGSGRRANALTSDRPHGDNRPVSAKTVTDKRHRLNDRDNLHDRAHRHQHPHPNTSGPIHRDPDTQTARELDEMDFSFFSDDINDDDVPDPAGPAGPGPSGPGSGPARGQAPTPAGGQAAGEEFGAGPAPLHDHPVAPVAIVSARDAAVVQDPLKAPPAIPRFNHHFVSSTMKHTIDQSRSGPVRRADVPASQAPGPGHRILSLQNTLLPAPKRLGMPPSQPATKRLRSGSEPQ